MNNFTELLKATSDFIWGTPLLILLLGTGIFLSIRLKLIQLFKFNVSFKNLFRKSDKEGDISPFQALTTALAASIGTGNIVGVATAIAAGGPGALFWMWITAFFGMATKYAETVLAIKYRIRKKDGEIAGGPMYYIERGLNKKWLGQLFALFAVIASFGIGNTVQSNSISDAMNNSFNIPPLITGIVIALFVGLVIIGGIKNIGKVTGILVPFMAGGYILGCLIILMFNAEKLPGAFSLIFSDAFTGTAAIGGFAGSTVMYAIKNGVARGVFSNEAGLGSAPIAQAAAQTETPVQQGLIAMLDTFIDTIIVCTFTGLVIISTGAWASGLNGVELTSEAFNKGLPGPGGFIVSLGIIFFAFSTILGWSYYGEKCLEYLFGTKSIKFYRVIFVVAIVIGAVANLEPVWLVADIMNALMAAPNLIGLIGLSGLVVLETRKYFDKDRI
ncbi:sodium:alanine symporter family protein [Clostridium sp. D2Q-14]|uniref:alanine/glycine:cation symporter family protein n=1 Tax=Anaeromonas gelatinilytica TaxID=2683194 RepID=UPI00193B9416|nr:sodium:alanine symporter family protein [Anaeromonas gelatinilytica]MBS4536395.1 sodium:alanine symporter family protein [Anaeromonas gelatinilytica]